MLERSRFRGSFNKQRGKRADALLKSASVPLYPIDWSLKSQLSWKKSLLLTCQVLGLLVNILAVDEKYPFLKRDSLTLNFKIQFTQKQKTFSQFFPELLKFRLNLECFETKYDPQRFFISEITARENLDR